MKSEKGKVLLVTTVSGFVPQFEMNNVKLLQSLGYEVHYAANYNTPVYSDNNDRLNNTGIVQHQIDFVRSPYSLKNFLAYQQLKSLMLKEQFEILHCHTPMGGVLARLAARKVKVPFVIYTAHGFHFFKGASCINWLFYYHVEKVLARYTNVLITINQEDFKNASKFHYKNNGEVKLIPGVGIDTTQNIQVKNSNLKKELGINEELTIITSVGELSKRKNHQVIIRAMSQVIKKYPKTLYIICGTGAKYGQLKKMIIKLQLQNNVRLLGYRSDIKEILKITDCFVFPSLQEGLPVAVLEAMNAGLPIICSQIRGNTDLIENGKGGYLVKGNSVKEYADSINKILGNKKISRYMGEWNKKRIKMFDQHLVQKSMKEIYKKSSKV